MTFAKRLNCMFLFTWENFTVLSAFQEIESWEMKGSGKKGANPHFNKNWDNEALTIYTSSSSIPQEMVPIALKIAEL